MSLPREEKVKFYAITGNKNVPTGVSISMFKNFIPRMFYDILIQSMVHVLFGIGCTDVIHRVSDQYEIKNVVNTINTYKNAVFDFVKNRLTALYGLNCLILSLLEKKKIPKKYFNSTLKSIRKMIREKRYGTENIDVDSEPTSFSSYEDYLTSGSVSSIYDIKENGEKIKEIIDRISKLEGQNYTLDNNQDLKSLGQVEEFLRDTFAKYGKYQSTGFFGALLEFVTDSNPNVDDTMSKEVKIQNQICASVNKELIIKTIQRFKLDTGISLASVVIGTIEDAFLKRDFQVDAAIKYFDKETITLENLNTLLCYTSNCVLKIKPHDSKLSFNQLLQQAREKSQKVHDRLKAKIDDICQKSGLSDADIATLLNENIRLIDITLIRKCQYPSAIDAFCPQGELSIELIPFYGQMRALVVDRNMEMFISQVSESGHITTTPSSPVSWTTRSASGRGIGELTLAIRNGLNDYAEKLKEKAKKRNGTSSAKVSKIDVERCGSVLWKRFLHDNVVVDLEQLKCVITEFKKHNAKALEKFDPDNADIKAINAAVEVIRKLTFRKSDQIDDSYAPFDPEHLNPFYALPGSLVITDTILKVSQDLLRFMEGTVKEEYMGALLNMVKGSVTQIQVKRFNDGETGLL